MDIILVSAIVFLLLVGAAGARWGAPIWVALPSLVLVGLLYAYGLIVPSWSGIGSSLVYVAVYLVLGCVYAWLWWEVKLRRARRTADTSRDSILAEFNTIQANALLLPESPRETLHEYLVRRGHIPVAANNKAEITGRVVAWPMHLLGDVLVWPGRWILSAIRGLRGILDRRARSKFSDFGETR